MSAQQEDTGLDCDLGYTLGVVFRAYVRATEGVIADIPGGPRGFQILSAAADGTTGRQGALAQRLGIDKTVMTYLVDDLEHAGLVERRPDPADRRNKRLVATARGTATVETLRERLQEAEDGVLAALSADERTAFRGSLRQVAAHAEQHTGTVAADRCSVVDELADDRC
jgi:DNA-binding MarR family transcriptional regulator